MVEPNIVLATQDPRFALNFLPDLLERLGVLPLNELRGKQEQDLISAEKLFSALSQRAFCGEL